MPRTRDRARFQALAAVMVAGLAIGLAGCNSGSEEMDVHEGDWSVETRSHDRTEWQPPPNWATGEYPADNRYFYGRHEMLYPQRANRADAGQVAMRYAQEEIREQLVAGIDELISYAADQLRRNPRAAEPIDQEINDFVAEGNPRYSPAEWLAGKIHDDLLGVVLSKARIVDSQQTQYVGRESEVYDPTTEETATVQPQDIWRYLVLVGVDKASLREALWRRLNQYGITTQDAPAYLDELADSPAPVRASTDESDGTGPTDDSRS